MQVVLPFDASSPVLRIAVVLIMAKKNEATGSGEFMRRVAGITKPLSVEKYRERVGGLLLRSLTLTLRLIMQ